MENLLESNERTLVMLDAVHAGLSECLVMVHADIRQMTEHRNELAQIEHQQLQAKLVSAEQLTPSKQSSPNFGKPVKAGSKNSAQDGPDQDDDPHHLASLKLLDKRLADSFSKALSMNDQQKSSIAAKHQISQSKPSIFQVLLGKQSKSSGKNNDAKSNKRGDKGARLDDINECEKLDNKTIIDDINKQTRLAMQYSKQLEAHLLKVEDLKARYEMHLKMGLVVKDVSRAYLLNGSPNSPSRQRNCNSLMINDSGSIGAHSSLSSLNLSTWSSSRSKSNKKAAAGNKPTGNDPYAPATNLRHGNQVFVSTVSLNGKNSKRLELSKLISPTNTSLKQQNSSDDHHQYVDSPNHPMESPASNKSKRRVSSQSIESPNKYAYGTDWAMVESPNSTREYNDKVANNLSRSNLNLTASRLSLKSSRSRNSSKGTIKEFIENIDKIETEFETFMGSFLLAIEDIQGFARVCQGDVFEITIKYGDAHKFKTKISVLKDNRQKCDNTQTVFKARIADVLAIKAYECKGLGKRVLLGHKLCETRDLFTARSQLMTISLNQTGSIKLNMVVTWNPLHMAPSSISTAHGLDISHISLPATPLSSSTLSSLSSGPSFNGGVTSTTINIRSPSRLKLNHSPTSSFEDHPNQRSRRDSMYQAIDPTYGYYIPPPDYITNEINCCDN